MFLVWFVDIFLFLTGLASYYYGHLEPNRAIELNRCYYNTMVDNPIYHGEKSNFTMCRTLEPNLKCQDCRKTKLEDIYSVHFTVCGKPESCKLNHSIPLCRELFLKWHRVRTSLELEWRKKYPGYNPGVADIGNQTGEQTDILRNFGGHCGPKYMPMVFPRPNSETEKLFWVKHLWFCAVLIKWVSHEVNKQRGAPFKSIIFLANQGQLELFD